jgi:hypothetical protein
MSKKFSLLVTVDDAGKLNSRVYTKEDVNKALEDFTKARAAGKEAYFFKYPIANKSCKSAAEKEAQKEALDN